MIGDDVSRDLFNKYQSLVENSVFKDLFKKARKNKYMLVNQYRSHEQIMNVVNIFYDDKLKLGNSSEQNEAKKHYLNVWSNGNSLFEENIHTYWFNSHYDINRNVSYEKKKRKGSIISTSFYNEEEIFLTKEILSALDNGYQKLLNEGKISEPSSVGVISLYGDQVSELKKEVSKMKFNALNFNKNKVSTVDEFQGKEEDIIIVNFVRNNPKFEAGEFVKKFERINVALSRARKMLIIVGSKPFFTSLKLDMENMDDGTIVNTRKIYKEIYDRVVGKIDEPNQYFEEVYSYED
jgi:superfamily I DNA and/or RNA helicase